MEERIETRVKPAAVWDAWERAHAQHGSQGFSSGQKGTSQKFRYKVLDVIPGKSFSIVWKTLFVQLIFHHQVAPFGRGSEILYTIEIKGPFGWMARWILGNKIRSNVRLVLKTLVKQLEEEAVK
jgi:hypothetical protein